MGSRTIDEAEQDPMLPEQFEIAVNATQIRTPELIEACKAVLVHSVPGPEIAAKLGVESSNVYRAVSSIKRAWEKICATEKWEYYPFAVPEDLIPMVMAFQRKLLKDYSENKGKRKRRVKK
jgi:hypothetical protein